MPADIAGRADVEALLREFYGRAFGDGLLGPVFLDVARMDLDAHLPVMADFWMTALFRTGQYRRNAFVPHARLHARADLTPVHFARWLALWQQAVDARHAGPKAELAKLQATRIADSMSRRLTGATSHGEKRGHDDERKRQHPDAGAQRHGCPGAAAHPLRGLG